MHTTTLHIHPRVTSPARIFEVRQMARRSGCTFVKGKPKPSLTQSYISSDPDDGGRAA